MFDELKLYWTTHYHMGNWQQFPKLLFDKLVGHLVRICIAIAAVVKRGVPKATLFSVQIKRIIRDNFSSDG